ncbi:MAG TPA: hypothetical protein VGD74_08855 [Vulgatibacter sp.]
MSNELAVQTNGAMVQREGFSQNESLSVVETSSAAVAAQAKAKTEAHFIMALKRPRDLMVARGKLLDACRRPGFAAGAIYRVPRGGKTIEGPSVRFAEEAIRALGNIQPEMAIVYDDAEKRIVRVTVTDLEANVPYSTDIVIEKKVERSSVKQGQKVYGQRINSSGKTAYIVEATEDDLQVKQAAQVSKAIRTNALRLVPGDILEEAIAQARATMRDENARDPAAAKKRIADNFAHIGVSPAELKRYLGRDLSEATPDDLAELHSIGMAIKDRETTWKEALEAKLGTASERQAKDLHSKIAQAAGVELPPLADESEIPEAF